MDMRPDHPWQEWKFSSAPRNFWQSPANVARFMEWASVELGIVKLEDWYAIRPARVLDLAGASNFGICAYMIRLSRFLLLIKVTMHCLIPTMTGKGS
jgi:hypothetical protein